MRIDDASSGLVLAVVGAGACAMAYRLGLGNVSHPGPGFFPLCIAAILLIMSLGLLARGCLQNGREPASGKVFATGAWRKPALTLTALVGYGASFDLVGFPASTFILLMILVWGIGRQKVLIALFVSTATVGVAYVLFVTFLGLQLPAGSIFLSLGG